MTAGDVAVAALVVFGVGVEVLCAIGLLVMRDPFDRLHYLGPASILGPLALAVAVLIDAHDVASRIKVVLIVLTLLIVGPVLTHATARAIQARQAGRNGGEGEKGGEP